MTQRLPALRFTLSRPLKQAEAFELNVKAYISYFPLAKSKLPLDIPFESDDEAVAAAVAWVVDHFGAPAPDVSLKVKNILHTASGEEAPATESEKGHTITFQLEYKGSPTRIDTVIYIRGRGKFAGHIAVGKFEELVGSQREIISRAQAEDRLVKSVRWPIRIHGLDVLIPNQLELKLAYVWAPIKLRGKLRLPEDTLVPTWFAPGGVICIDGFSGEVWMND
ncbi:MAG: hypothetical protein HY286_03745 [Planctomycetes bacterium]|nr:hypothetical protein [Planctomycetota bacterium]